ncbi:MAG: nicotinate-nucleotide adenylyltransferase [Gemmatimonadota bacterium]|nr:MAG: nicotinate-nucleotide adenylyltransferase [Gemmatimonadota bacterium]
MPGSVGILGGTFDPPHNGHLRVAQDVRQGLGLDRVLLMPVRVPPHKRADRVTPVALRMEMVRAAVADAPGLDVSAIEVEREGPSYTVDTLRQMRNERPDVDLTLIVGADQWAEMADWKEPEEIPELADLAVMNRGDRLPVEPDWDLALEWTAVSVTPVDVSSTEIRRMVAEGLPVGDFVPAEVLRIIEREKLYSNG